MITHPNVKLNLGLSVLRKREDGYHDLETLFVPYDEIHDTLEIITGEQWSETSANLFSSRPSDDISQAISPDGKVMVTIAKEGGVDWDPLSDLTVKAYRLLENDFNLSSVKIFLEKTSPVGAGLGGGSADASFALKMISEMFSLGLSEEAMSDYASRLGSDCAFFIYNRPMIGKGRGEILKPYPLDLDGYEIKVVVPEGIHVSTAEAYGGIVPRDRRGKDYPTIEEVLSLGVRKWKDTLTNDFEDTVFAKHPELKAIKASLYESGAVYASMSGSGSALFAIYEK